LDEIQRALKIDLLNDFIINDPAKLDRRIKRDIDKAIDDVTPEYDRIISDYTKKYKPKYMDEKNDESLCYSEECKKLAPPMRICSPVFEGIELIEMTMEEIEQLDEQGGAGGAAALTAKRQRVAAQGQVKTALGQGKGIGLQSASGLGQGTKPGQKAFGTQLGGRQGVVVKGGASVTQLWT